jgi:hypothetical protein
MTLQLADVPQIAAAAVHDPGMANGSAPALFDAASCFGHNPLDIREIPHRVGNI